MPPSKTRAWPRWRAALFSAVSALLVAVSVRAGDPEPSRPEVEPDLDAMVARVWVSPAAPAALEVQGPGIGPRRMESASVLGEHRFRIAQLPRGAWLTAQAVCGARRGAPIAFRNRPLGPEAVTVVEGPRGLTVRLRVPRRLECALLLRTIEGVTRVGGGAKALSHKLALPFERKPFSPDMRVRLSGPVEGSDAPVAIRSREAPVRTVAGPGPAD